jgi:sugar/nucleoside kinase (ribokinase family)
MAGRKTDLVILGGLRQDYFITHDGRSHEGILGGNAVYAAIGAKLWSDSISIISRVGSNFPEELLTELSNIGINIDGITVLPESHDTRKFYAYSSLEEKVDTVPPAHYLRINQPLPKELVNYQADATPREDMDSFDALTVRPSDLIAAITRAKGAHIAPTDYPTHISAPFHLREIGVPLINLDPSDAYMQPDCREKLSAIVNGLDSFLPSEEEAKAFFRPREPDPWEMSEAFAEMGCQFVVIKCGARGQTVLDRFTGRKWRIPAYPARVYDVTGAGDSFCGGFLAGLMRTDDPVEAALYGSVSASIVIEGTGALFALDSLPGLLQARLDVLRPQVKRV